MILTLARKYWLIIGFFVSLFVAITHTTSPRAASLFSPEVSMDAYRQYIPLLRQFTTSHELTAAERGIDELIERSALSQVLGEGFDELNFSKKNIGGLMVPTTNEFAADAYIEQETKRIVSEDAPNRVDTFVYDKYLSLVYVGKTVSVVNMTTDGAVAYDTLLAPTFTDTVSRYAVDQIMHRFPISASGVDTTIRSLVEHRSFRIAENGVVVIVPTESISGLTVATEYYEVLVPSGVVRSVMKLD